MNGEEAYPSVMTPVLGLTRPRGGSGPAGARHLEPSFDVPSYQHYSTTASLQESEEVGGTGVCGGVWCQGVWCQGVVL